MSKKAGSETYTQVLLQGVSREQEDELSSFCFEHGADGVSENLKFEQPELRYEPSVVDNSVCELSVYFVAAPSAEFFSALKRDFPGVTVSSSIEKNKDWLEEWKKGFEPFVFADPFWIIPSWREAPPEAREKIFVDPGMAFGTGTHETTQLAARLMVAHWATTCASPTSVLDIGTGTGILAIVTERLGATAVDAIDIDLECRRVARENIEINKCRAIKVPDLNVEEMKGPYDLVIANIVDGVLLDLKPELLRCLKPGATLVLSGILAEREKTFVDKFLLETQLTVIDRTAKGEWVGLLLK